jgi:hypothetical protein
MKNQNRAAYVGALERAHRDASSRFYQVPTLGPMQIISEYVRRGLPFSSGHLGGILKPAHKIYTFGQAHYISAYSPIHVAQLPSTSPGGNIVVARHYSSTPSEQIYSASFSDATYQYKETWPWSAWPWGSGWMADNIGGITINDCNDVAMTFFCSGQVVVFSAVTGEMNQFFGGYGYAPHQLVHPTGIVTLESSGDYALTEDELPHIKVLDGNGCFVRYIGPSLTAATERYASLCLTPDGDIAVSDLGNHSIDIYSDDGTLKRTLRPSGYDTTALTATADGYLLRADRNFSLQQLALDGQILTTHALMAGKRATSLCFTRERQLIVAYTSSVEHLVSAAPDLPQ